MNHSMVNHPNNKIINRYAKQCISVYYVLGKIMIELKLTPEFAHLHLQRLNDKQEYLLSLNGTALSTRFFVITFESGDLVNVHIDTRLDYLHNKEVFTFTFRTQPYPFYMKHFDNVSKFCHVNEKIDKSEKNIAQFKQSKFDQINSHGPKAKPSKFFRE